MVQGVRFRVQASELGFRIPGQSPRTELARRSVRSSSPRLRKACQVGSTHKTHAIDPFRV